MNKTRGCHQDLSTEFYRGHNSSSHNSHLFSFPTLSPLCLRVLRHRTVLLGAHGSAFSELQAISVILLSLFCINKCSLSIESVPLNTLSVMSAIKQNLSRSPHPSSYCPISDCLHNKIHWDYVCSLLQIPLFLEFTINGLSLPSLHQNYSWSTRDHHYSLPCCYIKWSMLSPHPNWSICRNWKNSSLSFLNTFLTWLPGYLSLLGFAFYQLLITPSFKCCECFRGQASNPFSLYVYNLQSQS